MEKAIICNKKRCKEVFHIHENRDPGGINDYGYRVISISLRKPNWRTLSCLIRY